MIGWFDKEHKTRRTGSYAFDDWCGFIAYFMSGLFDEEHKTRSAGSCAFEDWFGVELFYDFQNLHFFDTY